MNASLDKDKNNLINDIAQNIDCGYDCFYFPASGEVVLIPSLSQHADESEMREHFSKESEKIKNHSGEYIKFEPLPSYESFRIMEGFTVQIGDDNFRNRLEEALVDRKPFRNFKYLIDNSDYRQAWLDYKQDQLEAHVAKLIRHNRLD